jgi:hypothetical protein
MMPPNQFSGAAAGQTPGIFEMMQVGLNRGSGAAQFK